MELEITTKARKDIQSLPLKDRENVIDKIDVCINSNTSNIKKLINHDPEYRLRVGNYRVLFNIDNNTMIVARVIHRKNAYNN